MPRTCWTASLGCARPSVKPTPPSTPPRGVSHRHCSTGPRGCSAPTWPRTRNPMRLTALTLSQYGNFEDQRLTFSADKGVINLLMLPNGGGKSVMRTAFTDLLFGIGGQSPMGFRYPYNQMRILADAVD